MFSFSSVGLSLFCSRLEKFVFSKFPVLEDFTKVPSLDTFDLSGYLFAKIDQIVQ